MPENIFKLYRPSGRGKRGYGLWHNEPESDRLNHIKIELSRYCDKSNKDYDYLDLVWHIKNAVVGDIFFSEEVYKGIKNGSLWNKVKSGTDNYSIIEGILNRTTLQPKNKEFDETFLEVRKLLGKSGGALRFEHVIPANRYIEYLIDKFENEPEKFDDIFRDFRKKICVCIVTKDEDDRLTKNGRKKDIPNWDFSHDKFARYDSLIEIHRKDDAPQPHNYSFKKST